MAKVAVYGPKVGYDSYEVVTRGYIEGLTGMSIDTAWRPTGNSGMDPSDCADWFQAEIAVVTGPFPNLSQVETGRHKRKYVVLAPNSSWIPDIFYKWAKHIDGIIVPSDWGYLQVVSGAPSDWNVPVIVAPHGISIGFDVPAPGKKDSPNPSESSPRAVDLMGNSSFRILHLAGSALERKGTRELLRAFCGWQMRNDAQLVLAVNPFDVEKCKAMVDQEASGQSLSISILSRLNLPPHHMKHVYSSATIVCQPSRAEGFGLVPLEALACGVPVAITIGTGHLMYAQGRDGSHRVGVVGIPVGNNARVEYDPGGSAPTVAPEDIRVALTQAADGWAAYKLATTRAAESLRTEFSWVKTIARWLSSMEEKR